MYSSRRAKISLWRDSSHTWRAMSSWNSHGASGKSKSERPAASIAWNSPAQIPCRRLLRKSSSYGIALNGAIPCSRRASRILSSGTRMWSSGRASLSTGIILCMAFSSPSFGPRRPYAGQVDRFSDGPSVALRSDSELKREGRGRGSRQACLDEIMLHDPGFSQHLRIAVDPGFYRCGDLRDALAHVLARHRERLVLSPRHQRREKRIDCGQHRRRLRLDRPERLRTHYIGAISKIRHWRGPRVRGC